MDILVAIDTLDDFIHNAKMMPLSDDVRVDRDELLDHVERLRAGLRATVRESYRSHTAGSIEELARIAQAAPPVRLLGGVRLDKDEVYDLLDRMRMTVVDDIRVDRGGMPAPRADTALDLALDAVDDLLQGAKHVPLSDNVRVDSNELRRTVTAVRVATEAEITGETRQDALEVVARLEKVAADAKTVPLSDEVRVDREELFDQLDALRAMRRSPPSPE